MLFVFTPDNIEKKVIPFDTLHRENVKILLDFLDKISQRNFINILEKLLSNSKLNEKIRSEIPSKYYALYHWILIEMGTENNFAKNENDKYIRTNIEAFANERYPQISQQGFYKAFINIDITKKITIGNSFGNGYKQKVIEISNNNAKMINHLKNYPN